jgi:hypothetical protein
MARLFGMHVLELKPGVSAQEFERFLKDEWRPFTLAGVKNNVVKADRGSDLGRYLFVLETDSATRDRYWPTADGTGSDEFRRALQATGDRSAMDTRLTSFVKATPGAGTTYSDWVVIVELAGSSRQPWRPLLSGQGSRGRSACSWTIRYGVSRGGTA